MKLITVADQKKWSPEGHDGVTSQEVAASTHGAQHMVVHLSTLAPGGGSEVGRHPNSEQVFIMVSGELTFNDGEGHEFVAGPGTAVFVPADDPHGTENKGSADAVCLVVTAPPIE